MRMLLAAALLLIAAVPAVPAQEITGTWQGTLPTPQPQRIVLKIVRDENGTLRASSYRPGTGRDVLPMTSFHFTPPSVETEHVYLGVSFKGKLSEDGKSIVGTWTERKEAYPLTLALAAPDEVWKPDYTGDAAMAADADPSFDVATIKPTPPDQRMSRYGVRTKSFKAVNQSVVDMICWAYKLRPRQVEGAAGWMNEMHFDIGAKPDLPGQPSEDQYRLMVRKLLAERFGLKSHMSEKVFPVLALTVEKSAPLLTKSDLSVAGYHNTMVARQTPDGQFEGQFNYTSMADLAEFLMNFLRDRQIVDETGLKGRYDFSVKLPMEAVNGSAGEEGLPNAMLGAVHALGLKLVPKKEPLQVLVIDHVEQPSAN